MFLQRSNKVTVRDEYEMAQSLVESLRTRQPAFHLLVQTHIRDAVRLHEHTNAQNKQWQKKVIRGGKYANKQASW